MRRKTDERRHAIIDTAAQLFEEKGYSDTTMSDIAARLGGSKATLYSYFSSKEALLLAVVEVGARKDVADVFALLHTDQPLETRLRAFAVAFVRVLATPASNSLRRLVISEAGRSGVGRLLYEYGPRPLRVEAIRMVADEIAAGRLRRGDPVRTFQMLDAMLQGEPVINILFGITPTIPDEDLVASANFAVDTFLRAFAA